MKEINLKKTNTLKAASVRLNPFPGLRPFTVEESHLYFGRENQVDEIISKLNDNRFIAILGASGSGKSSLMYCGLIPAMEGGAVGENSSRWRIVKTRPGETPIENLAKSINKNSTRISITSELENNITESAIYATLRSNSFGLVGALDYLNLNESENLLLLVDQFEELFRFQNIHEQKEQALEFVQLLLNLVNTQHVPVYVVFTMRSDFVGECAQFPELAELINRSNYLIPQMTRADLKQAIRGPIAVAKGKISPNLINQLINDVGDNPDQLPILQHALMRTWDYWIRHRENQEPMDITHYMAIGGMAKALSDHANEAFAELTPQGEKICELMFKLLTEKQSEERGIRRPAPIYEIMAVSNATFEEVINVVNMFRQPGRAFLNSPSGNNLSPNSILDISHESLMRIWDRLRLWVEEEAQSAQMYLRLIEASEKHQLGSGNLWIPPDLHIGVNWRDKQKPNEEWARRYAPAYERATVFLDNSEREFNAAEQNKLRQQKKTLRRSRITAIILGIASIISIGFMLYAVTAQVEAEKQRLEAEKQSRIAFTNEKKAQSALILARKKTKEAKEQRKIAEKEKQKAETERQKALDLYKIANKQRQIALDKTHEAEQQKILADSSATIAKQQRSVAETEREKALKLRMISIAQSMAIKSQQIDRDTALAELLAYQAFLFNTNFGGEKNNNDIYNALYSAYYKTTPLLYFDKKDHSEAVRSIKINQQNNKLYSAGSDGIISEIDAFKNKQAKNIFKTKNILKSMIMTPDAKKLIVVTDNYVMYIIDLTQKNKYKRYKFNFKKGNIIIGFDSYTNSIMLSNENKFYLINSTKLNTLNPRNLKPIVEFQENITAFEKIENVLIISTVSGSTFKINFGISNKPQLLANFKATITKIAIDKTRNQAILGDINGGLYIFDLKQSQLLYRVNAHRARISDMQFSKNYAMLATAGFDGNVIIWNAQNYDIQPIVLKDASEWIWSVAFSADLNYVYAGYSYGKIHRWPLNTKTMAEGIKDKIPRNFSPKEWNRYIGKDIPLEKIK